MGRVSKVDLADAVRILNNASKRKYRLMGAYGRVKLVREYADGSAYDVTGLMPKRELYDVVSGITHYLEEEASA